MAKPTQSQKPLALATYSERKERLDLMLTNAEKQLKPADRKRIAQMLAVVAEMIGAPMPSEGALAMYIQILGDYPQDLVDMAGKHVIRHHKYNTFPRLADFEEPVRDLLRMRQQNLKETHDARRDYLKEH